MPFIRERITTSIIGGRNIFLVGRAYDPTRFLLRNRVRLEDIALTWPTRQVVLWSDQKTAGALACWFLLKILVGAVDLGKQKESHGNCNDQPGNGRTNKEF